MTTTQKIEAAQRNADHALKVLHLAYEAVLAEGGGLSDADRAVMQACAAHPAIAGYVSTRT